jgi:hypothetical protein
MISTYKQQLPNSIYKLSCNPYKTANCETTPTQSFLDQGDNAVCGYIFPEIGNKSSASNCLNYEILSFNSAREAENSGAIITHAGSCGLCSSTQDLASYLSKYIKL